MDITGIFSEAFWYIAPILVTMTTFLAGLVNQGIVDKFVPTQHHGWLKQLVAWVFGAGLSVAAWGLKVITFGNPVWLGVIALCVVVGLSSNGVYDVQFIRNWIETWFKPKALGVLGGTTPVVNDNATNHLNKPETVEEFVQKDEAAVEEKPLKVKKSVKKAKTTEE